jgi:hypothetical protein
MNVFIPLEDATLEHLGPRDRLVPFAPGMTVFTRIEILDAGSDPSSRGKARADRQVERPAQPPSRR